MLLDTEIHQPQLPKQQSDHNTTLVVEEMTQSAAATTKADSPTVNVLINSSEVMIQNNGILDPEGDDLSPSDDLQDYLNFSINNGLSLMAVSSISNNTTPATAELADNVAQPDDSGRRGSEISCSLEESISTSEPKCTISKKSNKPMGLRVSFADVVEVSVVNTHYGNKERRKPSFWQYPLLRNVILGVLLLFLGGGGTLMLIVNLVALSELCNKPIKVMFVGDNVIAFILFVFSLFLMVNGILGDRRKRRIFQQEEKSREQWRREKQFIVRIPTGRLDDDENASDNDSPNVDSPLFSTDNKAERSLSSRREGIPSTQTEAPSSTNNVLDPREPQELKSFAEIETTVETIAPEAASSSIPQSQQMEHSPQFRAQEIPDPPGYLSSSTQATSISAAGGAAAAAAADSAEVVYSASGNQEDASSVGSGSQSDDQAADIPSVSSPKALTKPTPKANGLRLRQDSIRIYRNIKHPPRSHFIEPIKLDSSPPSPVPEIPVVRLTVWQVIVRAICVGIVLVCHVWCIVSAFFIFDAGTCRVDSPILYFSNVVFTLVFLVFIGFEAVLILFR